jgi:hypothetical protein
MCCETTARVGANLGFEMSFAIDATHTFDLDDHEGCTIAADEARSGHGAISTRTFPSLRPLVPTRTRTQRNARTPAQRERHPKGAALLQGAGEGAAPERVCIYIHHRHTILQF